MQHPSDVDSPSPLEIRAATRGNQCPVVPGALLAPLRRLGVRISADVPYLHRPWFQQLGRDQLGGVPGAGALRGQREPDAADANGPRPLPTVPPARLPVLTPRGFGSKRGLPACPGQPMLSIGNTKPLFTCIPPPVPPRATGTTPRRTSRASGWPALDAAGRPPARAVGHGQDGWLVTGSLLGLLGGHGMRGVGQKSPFTLDSADCVGP
jgi:hypothetical protein